MAGWKRYEFGEGMGPHADQNLFLATLPGSMKSEIYTRPGLKGLDRMQLGDWARHQTMWERSEELAAQLSRPEKVIAFQAGGSSGSRAGA